LFDNARRLLHFTYHYTPLTLDDRAANCVSHRYSDNDDNTDNTGEIGVCSNTSSTNTSGINGSSSDRYRACSPSGERANNNVKGTSTRDDGNSAGSISSPLSDRAAHSFGNGNMVYDSDRGCFSDNSNNSGFAHDPGGTSFSNALDHANDTTDNGDTKHNARDNGPSTHSSIDSSSFTFDPGGHGLNDKHNNTDDDRDNSSPAFSLLARVNSPASFSTRSHPSGIAGPFSAQSFQPSTFLIFSKSQCGPSPVPPYTRPNVDFCEVIHHPGDFIMINFCI
jgi:hypothetical protein